MLERDLVALLQVDAADARRDPPSTAERHCNLLAINRKPSEAFAANAEEEVAGFGGREESRPLHAESLSFRQPLPASCFQ